LITARCALDEGREVLAVPGFPGQPGSQGTNRLIRDGAALVRDAADVAAELGLVPPPAAAEVATATDAVLGALRPDVPASVPELQERSGRPVAELLARLSELELASKVRRLPGALFVRQ
jgi:DNA processing protein